MAPIDDERSTTSLSQIEKLNEKNYRSWATTVRAILREKKLFDVVEGKYKAPAKLEDDTSTDEHTAYDAALEAYEKKSFPACRILLSTISSRLITYVEDEDDPARIWTTLKDRFRPTTDITMAQALKGIIGMRMAENDDMEAHIRDFTAGKRRLEEHGVSLEDIVYRTIFLLSMPAGYQMTVTALEGQTDMKLEAIQNRLLDEYRKRKSSPTGGSVMSALLTDKSGRKGRAGGRNSGTSRQSPVAGPNSSLHCTHCRKAGHVESTCWTLHPELRRSGRPSIKDSANVAFHTSSDVIRSTSIKADGNIGEKCDPNHWILDSGASEHFSPYRQLYSSYVPLREAVNVFTAKGELQGVGIGAIEVMVEDGGGSPLRITLLNVLHVPEMDVNLISTNILLKNGAEINMHPQCGTKIIMDGRVVATTVPHGKLSRLRTIDRDVNIGALKTSGPKPLATQEPSKLPYDTWHRRLAHLGLGNVKKIQQMATGIAIDTATFPAEDEKCESCIQGGQTMHYSQKPMRRRTVPGDLIHSDICGWITPNSLGNARYFLIFIDDATRMVYLYVLPFKTALEVRNAFMEFRNVFEQDGRRVKSMRTDGGGEYRKQMGELCTELGIHHEETAPYTPHQNGVAERANRTICERIRSILAETNLPKTLWAELARTVVYLKNRSPTRSLKDRTPYEALYGVKPDLSHLIAVGTKAMPHIPKSKNQKLDSRADEGIMVGYGGSNQYRIWSPIDNKVTVTAYADFINEFTRSKATAMEPTKVTYDMIEVLPEPPATPVEHNEVVMEDDPEDLDLEISRDNEEPQTDAREISLEPDSEGTGSTHSRMEGIQPEIEVRLPPRRRAPPARYEPEEWTRYAAHMSTTMWSESMEPQNYQEAINHPLYKKEWELAIKEEYESLMSNGAWELVEAPPGRNIVTCKWVFKVKRDAEGRVVRFKARLVARGFTQAYGVDYLETYSPVAKLTTYRVIFALAALEQWEVHGMDVITAFLLGLLDEEIFMVQPEGFERQGMKAKMVCRLLRSIYGLKQASRVWNIQLHEFLIKIGFKRSNADTCLYVNPNEGVIIAIWVDDIIVAGKSAVNIAKVKKQLAGVFKMKDLGQLNHFLGMQVTRTNGDISIDQSMYIRDILARFGMEDSKPVSTPLATSTKLIRLPEDSSSGKSESDIQPLYQSIVGSLMYTMLCTVSPTARYTTNLLRGG